MSRYTLTQPGAGECPCSVCLLKRARRAHAMKAAGGNERLADVVERAFAILDVWEREVSRLRRAS